MTKIPRILSLTAFAAILAATSAGAEWIQYDNGTAFGGGNEDFYGVRFTLPSGDSARLRTVQYYYNAPRPIHIIVTEDDHVTQLASPLAQTIVVGGWQTTADLSSLGIALPQYFYIVLEGLPGGDGSPVYDNASNVGRSFVGSSLAGLTSLTTGNLLIRVEVEYTTPIPSPTATPTPGLAVTVNSTSPAVGGPFTVDAAVQPLPQTFDAYGVLFGPGGAAWSFVLGLPGELRPGVHPLARGVSGLASPYEVRLLDIPAIPGGTQGNYQAVVGLVPAGVSPHGAGDAIPGFVDQKDIAVH